MYSDVVMEVGKKYFEALIDQMKERKGVTQDVDLTAEDLKELAGQFKAEYRAKLGVDFPTDPKEQLMGAIQAVFRSWDNPRANIYRRENDIPYSWGTAVNVQSMAFGNMGDDCGTGVAFTRNPATGEKKLFGEFLGKKYFEALIDQMKERKGVTQDVDLTAEDLKELAGQFKAEYRAKLGVDFPTDPKEQLMGAIQAVFRSWDNPRANIYRRENDIPYSWGTAVNVQSMAFGNMGDDCGTGVAFTRNPATGEKKLFGEFLTNAQGEDVVAGVRTPMPITQMAEKFPHAYAQFENVCSILEDHYRDMQDMEFTVNSPMPMPSLRMSAPFWKITTGICRTWSSPWKTATCICSRPATASAPPQPH